MRSAKRAMPAKRTIVGQSRRGQQAQSGQGQQAQSGQGQQAQSGTQATRAPQSTQRLREENRALRKSVQALMARVEKAVDEQGSQFSWFQAAASLEETIRQRTEQYEQLNVRLQEELESRREIELALKQAKELADRANETKTRFLAAASHDLRQPLSSAMLFLESIEESVLMGQNHDYLQKARVALASLSNLLDTLLDVARLDSGAIEPHYSTFPVHALLDKLVSEFSSVARSAGLELRYVRSNAWVRCDQHLLETVLRNLISNAIRYTPQGRILVGCRPGPEGLKISVYDTGIGIEPEHLGAIFSAYYQVAAGRRGRSRGIGLGLSIVERITALLSLKRLVRSIPGRGSMFGVQVPYGERAGAGAAQTGASSDAASPALAIAVIDDDPGVRQGLAATLIKWGHRPIAAATATEAVVQLIGADLSPDFIISDYHLAGGIKGDAAIEEVRREFDRTPAAAIMTSDPDPQLRAHARAKGLALLQKPLSLPALRTLLERAGNR